MKSILFSILTIACTIGLNAQDTYQVNIESTTIKWIGKKVSGEHYGMIKVKKGSLNVVDGQIQNGEMIIDMNSITCDDIDDKESNENLVEHLKNEDFFHSSFFSEAKLAINKLVKLRSGDHKVSATLTIKGISKQIVFNSKVDYKGNHIHADAKIVFDRTHFNIRYGSKLFGAAVDRAIEDKVSLDIHLEASRN